MYYIRQSCLCFDNIFGSFQSLRESVIVEDVREVCRYHGRKATESLEAFPASEAKDTLQQMVRVLVQ